MPWWSGAGRRNPTGRWAGSARCPRGGTCGAGPPGTAAGCSAGSGGKPRGRALGRREPVRLPAAARPGHVGRRRGPGRADAVSRGRAAAAVSVGRRGSRGRRQVSPVPKGPWAAARRRRPVGPAAVGRRVPAAGRRRRRRRAGTGGSLAAVPTPVRSRANAGTRCPGAGSSDATLPVRVNGRPAMVAERLYGRNLAGRRGRRYTRRPRRRGGHTRSTRT